MEGNQNNWQCMIRQQEQQSLLPLHKGRLRASLVLLTGSWQVVMLAVVNTNEMANQQSKHSTMNSILSLRHNAAMSNDGMSDHLGTS